MQRETHFINYDTRIEVFKSTPSMQRETKIDFIGTED